MRRIRATGARFALPPSERGVELRIEDGHAGGRRRGARSAHLDRPGDPAIDAYYGRFPVRHARLIVERVDGSGVRWARTFAHSGAFIRVGVGERTTATEFASDWMLTHEFVHLALPRVADEHDWLQEGAATYVEPIARAQAGQLSPERVWAEFALDMPQRPARRG